MVFIVMMIRVVILRCMVGQRPGMGRRRRGRFRDWRGRMCSRCCFDSAAFLVDLELDNALVARFGEQRNHAVARGAHGFRRRRFCDAGGLGHRFLRLGFILGQRYWRIVENIDDDGVVRAFRCAHGAVASQGQNKRAGFFVVDDTGVQNAMRLAFVEDVGKFERVVLARKGDLDFPVGCGDFPVRRRFRNHETGIIAMLACTHGQNVFRRSGRGASDDCKKKKGCADHAASFFNCFRASSMSEKPGRS